MHYFTLSPCWIPPVSPGYLLFLYFILFPQQIMPYHHIWPASLVSSTFFPLRHYSEFHFSCLPLWPFLLISFPPARLSIFIHSLCILRADRTHLLLCNLPSRRSHQPLNQTALLCNCSLSRQARKHKFVSSGPLAPDQPLHSVCSSHPERVARQ